MIWVHVFTRKGGSKMSLLSATKRQWMFQCLSANGFLGKDGHMLNQYLWRNWRHHNPSAFSLVAILIWVKQNYFSLCFLSPQSDAWSEDIRIITSYCTLMGTCPNVALGHKLPQIRPLLNNKVGKGEVFQTQSRGKRTEYAAEWPLGSFYGCCVDPLIYESVPSAPHKYPYCNYCFSSS